MNQQEPPEIPYLKGWATFFSKALDVIKHPVMRFFTVLVVALLLFSILRADCTDSALVVGLFFAVILILALLATALWYVEKLRKYNRLTEEELKDALREVVLELQEERTRKTKPEPKKTRRHI